MRTVVAGSASRRRVETRRGHQPTGCTLSTVKVYVDSRNEPRRQHMANDQAMTEAVDQGVRGEHRR